MWGDARCWWSLPSAPGTCAALPSAQGACRPQPECVPWAGVVQGETQRLRVTPLGEVGTRLLERNEKQPWAAGAPGRGTPGQGWAQAAGGPRVALTVGCRAGSRSGSLRGPRLLLVWWACSLQSAEQGGDLAPSEAVTAAQGPHAEAWPGGQGAAHAWVSWSGSLAQPHLVWAPRGCFPWPGVRGPGAPCCPSGPWEQQVRGGASPVEPRRAVGSLSWAARARQSHVELGTGGRDGGCGAELCRVLCGLGVVLWSSSRGQPLSPWGEQKCWGWGFWPEDA